MKIIAITGFAGSGKDTVAKFLADHYGYTQIAFADPMREMLFAMFRTIGISNYWATNRVLKEQNIDGLGVSYRRLAQTLGTEWARNQLGEDFWIKALVARIKSSKVDKLVISDLRFVNECTALKELGAVVWKVDRQGIQLVRPHQSEAEIPMLVEDFVINNNGSFEELNANVAEAYAKTENRLLQAV